MKKLIAGLFIFSLMLLLLIPPAANAETGDVRNQAPAMALWVLVSQADQQSSPAQPAAFVAAIFTPIFGTTQLITATHQHPGCVVALETKKSTMSSLALMTEKGVHGATLKLPVFVEMTLRQSATATHGLTAAKEEKSLTGKKEIGQWDKKGKV